MTISISIVALGQGARIEYEGIPKAWAARWPKSPQPTDHDETDGTLSYRVGECQVIYGMMPAPIPDIERLCTNAAFWPDAATEMRGHKKHVVVTVTGETNRVEQMTVLTQATIALTDSSKDAIGVYWCNSSHVLSPAKFAEIACQFIPHGLPLPIWVNFHVAKNPDGTSAGCTTGLAAFDLRELETTKSPESPNELRDRFLGLADYAIRNGSVIKDGDTIGEDAHEKIKVTFAKSSFGADGDVLRLDYDGSKGPEKKLTTYGRIHALATLACTIGFGYCLYAFFPFLRDSVLRHFLFLPTTVVFGFILLLVSDKFLQKNFGLEAFDTPKGG